MIDAPERSALARALDAIRRCDWASAKSFAEAALAADPLSPDAHHTVGVVHCRTGSMETAIWHLKQSVESRADATWLNNLGVAHAAAGQWMEASSAFERSLDLRPGEASTLAHYGRALCERGRYDAARQILEKAIAAEPAQAAAWVDLGRALWELGALAGSRSALVRAVELNPDAARAHRLLTHVCRAVNCLDASARHARILTELEPGADSFTELALALWRAGDLAGALESADRAFGFGIGNPNAHSGMLYLMLFDPAQSGPQLGLAHRSWALTHCRCPAAAPAFADLLADNRKLRIGYFTADLFTSPVRYSHLPLLMHADTSSFEVFVYGSQPASAGDETRYAEIPGLYRNVHRLSDSELFAQLRTDEIDVLVDLVGHHSYGRLQVFANRPAPVQIAYTSYPCTTGIDQMDYFLTDAATTPAGTECEYSEEVWRMSAGYLMYAPPEVAPPVPPLPARANGFVTFGLFQRKAKLNDAFWDAVAKVLNATSDACLLVHHSSPRCDFEVSQPGESHMVALHSRGIARDRVTFIGSRPLAEHLQILAHADIALDTFPYNGHNTTCECLWMGVPTVTLSGDRHAGRVGTGLLRQAGLDPWIAHSVEQYIDIATRAAREIPAMEHLRATLRGRLVDGTLLDTRARTRDIENVYRQAWERWRQQSSNAAAGGRG